MLKEIVKLVVLLVMLIQKELMEFVYVKTLILRKILQIFVLKLVLIQILIQKEPIKFVYVKLTLKNNLLVIIKEIV
jgi:hypothetical protein